MTFMTRMQSERMNGRGQYQRESGGIGSDHTVDLVKRTHEDFL